MICLFGGTFDPVHNGHLHAAKAVAERLRCPVRLVLCAQPPHRPPPMASARHRWAMLNIACSGRRLLIADDMEMRRQSPSYTVDTLALARRDYPREPLFWLIGLDAFQEIETWHRWREVFGLAHLLLLNRPGAALDARTGTLYERRRLQGAPTSPCGGILNLPAPMLDVSASQIRAARAVGGRISHLLPEGVATYIRRQRLYTGD